MQNLRIHTDNTLSATGELIFDRDGEYCYGRRAFTHGDRIGFTLLLPRALGTSGVLMKMRNDHTGSIIKRELVWNGRRRDMDVYSCLIDTNDDIKERCGLFFIGFSVNTVVGEAFAYKPSCGSRVAFRIADGDMPFSFQLTVSDFSFAAPEWIYGGTIYHVFVDRFCRTVETPVRSDSILNTDWDNGIPEYPDYPGAHLENNTFFGGNLYGVTDKLDYIASLGVNCIYLSPIFEAYSNHKYDTGNYMKVDESFGGESALEKLISEASKRNIRIILDGVFNHTGADSIYFNKYGKYDSLGAYQSKESKYYSWYDFKHFPDDYTSWWGIKTLPRIHTDRESCGEYFVGKGGVCEHYMKMGIAGFRLDVVDELSDSFVSKLKGVLDSENGQSILYGEVWEDASNKIAYDIRKKYYMGTELDGVMNYPYRTAIIEYLRNKNTGALEYALTDVLPNMPKRISDAQMNLLGTHDTERIITALAAPSSEGKSNHILAHYKMTEHDYIRGSRLLKLAYLIIATLPGVPCIYYGDEVGMQGYKDPFNRMPYPWKNPDCDIRDFYTAIGSVRKNNDVYKCGEFNLLCLESDVLAFSRKWKEEEYITVVNNSAERIFAFGDGASDVFGVRRLHDEICIEPYSGCIIRMDSAKLGTFDIRDNCDVDLSLKNTDNKALKHNNRNKK